MAAARKTVTVVQTGSPIGRRADQEATLEGPGAQQAAPPARARGHARGARHDRKVKHLVRVESEA